MKSGKIKKILGGVQIAALVASVTIMTSYCHGNCKKDSGGSYGSKMKMQQDDPNSKDPNAPKSSCGKGSCGGKGSCSK